jgi:selenide,water dikinase
MRSNRPIRDERTVVLVGGGHAHVQVLRSWAMRRPSNARLLVVLDQPVAVYSGMVPGRVAGDYDDPALEIDVVPLARRAGVGVILAAATDVDPVRRALSIQGRRLHRSRPRPARRARTRDLHPTHRAVRRRN